ncbi:UbiH/UbiF/VisC/COQ6 family ubiquinone biosynthesis hydroxylase [uncultured Thiothrix sp.]|uniref:UbiH/UbiF/VisC/COQ6 family ubiquinone biosynthesis hydroxylase n=1 Tax=uncultured Thiothrix sp. TaxID=223185 RepID=UPI00260C8359|nr:UbiH/UbiF/VisC/COQ6 family ubiquinone biosynthesis hydroxylase [uncultured Thiothrix sp.]HMT93601.1 UbiH/UbiF/VisC/COQ6 family ubiquinone biosynthesis hydroxylase [Thiolinea sp.]
MDYEIIIAGGGMVGAALACLLGQVGKQVAVLEAAVPPAFSVDDPFDNRVSALSRASQRLLEQAGAWDNVLKMRASPYEAMQVWDATGSGMIRFEAAEIGEPDLGHIVENRVLQLALLTTLKRYPSVEVLCPARLSGFELSQQQIQVHLTDGSCLSAQLLVGADGAQSVVRSLAELPYEVSDYAQKAVVCTVYTALPHLETAWQRFQTTGPVAFLPLPDPYACSIVWTLPADQADAALLWDEVRFQRELGQALDFRLGEIISIGERAAFPLRGLHVQSYVCERVALLGDAAHTIHPLAGQGVNLGFKDAQALAELIVANESIDYGSLKLLRRYERARRGDNLLTQKAMEGFSLLFGNTLAPWQLLRNQGLTTVNHLSRLKYQLAKRAMGL